MGLFWRAKQAGFGPEKPGRFRIRELEEIAAVQPHI
jgi:hypothetical protein